MELMHNQAIRITGTDLAGIYRVILDEPALNQTILVRLDPTNNVNNSKGGRKRLEKTKRTRKKPRAPLIGKLIWQDRSVLLQLYADKYLQGIEIERPIITKKPGKNNSYAQSLYTKRVTTMEPFLSIDSLRRNITKSRGIAILVEMAISKGILKRNAIYFLFSKLCRYGFSEKSLEDNFNNCGAPNVSRPCDPGGRKKPGAKTVKEKMSILSGSSSVPEQPGMSSEWTQLILAADKGIKSPKPPMPERITQIVNSKFITRYRQTSDGKLEHIDPEQGSYPNRRQIERVLTREISKLERLLQKTTPGHYDRSLRGLRGKSWKGVSGPGHTWAIDSTIGDIYLRSSVNRAWIIGRPIVYIIADVWSTAVVGFYVCLMGPSWDMAKLALFCSGADPTLIGALWGCEETTILNPVPTLPATLLCDRGEYLSLAAKITGSQLIPSLSYTPPYRPDLKGLVEVLHRIKKDKMYNFVPGSIDARRAEYELRRFNPHTAVLTVREFVHYLYVIFNNYNLTANREHRLDAHLKGQSVAPTPAGLWQWGHAVGLGTQRSVLPSELVTSLLPSADARVSADGIHLGTRRYESEIVDEKEWTAYARNFGGWTIPSHYFPGSTSTIWTPNVGDKGLIKLTISDQSTAAAELTWDEVLDSDAYYRIGRSAREHSTTLKNLETLRKTNDIIAAATIKTNEALEAETGEGPSLREARHLEAMLGEQHETVPIQSATSVQDQIHDEATMAYLNSMRALLESQ